VLPSGLSFAGSHLTARGQRILFTFCVVGYCCVCSVETIEAREFQSINVKIAIFQGPELPQSAEQNLKSLELRAKEAAAQGARLLIAPEMFLTGYNIGPEQVSSLAEAAGGPSSQTIAKIAVNAGIAILYGYRKLLRKSLLMQALRFYMAIPKLSQAKFITRLKLSINMATD